MLHYALQLLHMQLCEACCAHQPLQVCLPSCCALHKLQINKLWQQRSNAATAAAAAAAATCTLLLLLLVVGLGAEGLQSNAVEAQACKVLGQFQAISWNSVPSFSLLCLGPSGSGPPLVSVKSKLWTACQCCFSHSWSCISLESFLRDLWVLMVMLVVAATAAAAQALPTTAQLDRRCCSGTCCKMRVSSTMGSSIAGIWTGGPGVHGQDEKTVHVMF
jgi:hypothetical protein